MRKVTLPATCCLCGKPIERKRDLTMEHLRPTSRGGARHGKKNVQPAHRACNQKKGDRTLAEFKAGHMSPREAKVSLELWNRATDLRRQREARRPSSGR